MILRQQSDYWLGQQGRLTRPMVKRAGATPLRGDHMGRCIPVDRDRTERVANAERRRVLHERTNEQ